MAKNAKEQAIPGKGAVEKRRASKVMDIRDLYKFKPEDLTIDVSATYYSNLAYIQVAPRDVIIDFLIFPGVKKDGKMVIDGARVLMTHVAAQKLVERLSTLLEVEYNKGKMEMFELPQPSEEKLTTKVTRSSEEEQA
jgi:hypothetical protein